MLRREGVNRLVSKYHLAQPVQLSAQAVQYRPMITGLKVELDRKSLF